MVGVFSENIERENCVKSMCNCMAHGGPDDEGFYYSPDDRLVLGNRRLSLVDLSLNGHMPMAFESRYYITFNGEIFNYQELKIELGKLGYNFSNHTDTEVILAAYAQWKTLAFSKLKGMFAFALWDSLEKELYLVRDPAGIKPLYYSLNSSGLSFASEIRAFSYVSPQPPREPWEVYLMAYGHIPEPVTTIAGVKPLPKGCFLKYETVSQRESLQSFSHYSYIETYKEPMDIRNRVSNLIEDSVKRHLVADAPVGVFLSGGLDSGIVALLASRFEQAQLKTLSVYFKEAYYSEKKYQDLLQQKLNCQHHQFLLEEREFNENLPHIFKAMDMPSCDGINTWFISRHARMNGMKAVLSGLGGDELFGGYPSFSRMRIARNMQDRGADFMRLGKLGNHKVLKRLQYLQIEGIHGIYLFLRGLFSPDDIAKHLDMEERQVWEILSQSPVYPNIRRIHKKNQAGWMEFNMYMQNQLLRDADVMGMIHGVEIRVPFLYEDVIRYANSIAPSVKFQGKLPKQLLVDSFSGILPREIYDRPKMGFSFPFQEWLKSSSYVKELLVDSGPVLKKSYHDFLKNKMHWSQFMTLVILRQKGSLS